MKRLLSLCLLMLCLSLPVFGGHTQVGDWCESGTPGCISGASQTPVPDESSQETPSDVGSETLLILVVLLALLR